MDKYTPKPINVDAITLPEELNELLEQIAKNVHEVWSEGRIADGWQYGEKRDDHLKSHPCLIPYDSLPEGEKEYDRQTALSTLKLIYKLGFRIEKQ